jgi:membrane-associated phospholipid phosphatase
MAPHGRTGQRGMQSILISLSKRRQWAAQAFPPLRWQVCLFVTANIVLLSALLFDAPLGAVAGAMAAPIHNLARFLTDFGESGWIIIASVFLMIEGWAGMRRARTARHRCGAAQISCIGSYVFLSVALSGLLANILKRMIGRARPKLFQEWGILGFSPFSNHPSFESFPSGHATTFGALFAALSFLFPRYRLAFATCALWLAATRVIIGAHYPSDVVAGLALGAWFAFMLAVVYGRHRLLFRVDKKGWPMPKRLILLRKKAGVPRTPAFFSAR